VQETVAAESVVTPASALSTVIRMSTTRLLPEREYPNTPAEIIAFVKAQLAGTVFKEKKPGPEAEPLLTV
jgi:hypothetical protein